MMASFFRQCHDNNVKGVEECLCQGSDVNMLSEDGRWSALTIAAHQNYPELLDILLSHHNIKINKTTRQWPVQWTALMWACNAGNPGIVSRLVEVPGLDIMYQDEEGDTAAHRASERGHSECLRILAETGRFDWNRRNRLGRTPLHRALERGHPDCVDTIVREPDIDYSVKTLYLDVSLAMAAVRGGSTRCVETLAALERFDCWNDPDRNGDTPVMKALKEGKTVIFEKLVRCPRVDLDCRDSNGRFLEDVARELSVRKKLEILKTFTSVRLRMIQQDSRESDTPPSLLDISRDSVLVTIITSNTEEREVKPLVDRLEGIITRRAREILLNIAT